MNILLLFACTSSEKTPDSAVSEAKQIDELSFEANPTYPNIGVVRYTLSESSVGWVEFGPTEDYGAESGRSATDGEVLLMGIPAGETWHWRLHAETVDGEQWASEDQVLTSSVAPEGLYPFTVDASAADDAFGYVLLVNVRSTSVGDGPDLLLLDLEGRPVWWKNLDTAASPSRARISNDGKAVIYNSGAEGGNYIERIALADDDTSQISAPAVHHDFVELPEGGYGYVATDVRLDPEWGNVFGDAIWEVSADGTLGYVISTWDWLPLELEEADADFYPDGYDWTHCNGLDYEPLTRRYLLSCKKEDAVFFVDRDSHTLLSTLGGPRSDWTLESGTAFSGQHAPLLSGDELWVFDNQSGTSATLAPRAALYQLAPDAGTYKELWSGGQEAEWVESHGNVQPLSTGNYFIGWGSAGKLSEVDEKGHLVWELSGEEASLGYAERIESFGGTP